MSDQEDIQKERDRLLEENNDLKEQRRRLREERDHIFLANNILTKQRNEVQEELNGLRWENQQLQAQSKTADREELDRLLIQRDGLKRCINLMSTLLNLKNKIADFCAEQDQLQKEITDLRVQHM